MRNPKNSAQENDRKVGNELIQKKLKKLVEKEGIGALKSNHPIPPVNQSTQKDMEKVTQNVRVKKKS